MHSIQWKNKLINKSSSGKEKDDLDGVALHTKMNQFESLLKNEKAMQ